MISNDVCETPFLDCSFRNVNKIIDATLLPLSFDLFLNSSNNSSSIFVTTIDCHCYQFVNRNNCNDNINKHSSKAIEFIWFDIHLDRNSYERRHEFNKQLFAVVFDMFCCQEKNYRKILCTN